jgi:hypothetical protein
MRLSLRKISHFVLTFGLLIALPFTLSSCSSIKYHEIQPAAAELTPLTYYRWETPAVTSKSGPRAVEFDTNFRTAIEADLAKKGYIKDANKAEILVDYRISVLTRPNMEDTYYAPHPQGTGDMLKHGIVTLSMRAAKTNNLLWEGGVSKLLRSDESEINMTEASKIAANAISKKVPAHK